MKRFGTCFLTLGVISLFIAAMSVQQSFADTSTGPAPQDKVWERDKLTGDWGGARSQLKAAGVNLDLEFTMF